MSGNFKCSFCYKIIATKVRRCRSCLASFHPGCLDTKLRRDKSATCCPGAPIEDVNREFQLPSSGPSGSSAPATACAAANTSTNGGSQYPGSADPASLITNLISRVDAQLDSFSGRLAHTEALDRRLAAAEARIVALENVNHALSEDNTALRNAQQSQLADIASLQAQVSRLENDCRALSKDLAALKQSQLDCLADINERSRATGLSTPVELIISGVPCTSAESIPATINQVAASLNCDLAKEDIIDSRFLVTREKAQKSSPLPIIVKLRDRAVLVRLIAAKRSKGRMFSSDLIPCPGGRPTAINLNEALPSETYKLLLATKSAARTAGIRYVWHSDGTIFVCKAQGTPVKRVTFTTDLARLGSD